MLYTHWYAGPVWSGPTLATISSCSWQLLQRAYTAGPSMLVKMPHAESGPLLGYGLSIWVIHSCVLHCHGRLIMMHYRVSRFRVWLSGGAQGGSACFTRYHHGGHHYNPNNSFSLLVRRLSIVPFHMNPSFHSWSRSTQFSTAIHAWPQCHFLYYKYHCGPHFAAARSDHTHDRFGFQLETYHTLLIFYKGILTEPTAPVYLALSLTA